MKGKLAYIQPNFGFVLLATTHFIKKDGFRGTSKEIDLATLEIVKQLEIKGI